MREKFMAIDVGLKRIGLAFGFGEVKEQEKADDEILKFCKNGVSLDEALAKFGEIIYEYELDGLVEISNLRVKSAL